MIAQPSVEADAVKSHSDRAGQLACDVLGNSLESVSNTLTLAATLWKDDPEHVHQLRVSSRRALAAFQLFSDFIPATDKKWFTKRLKVILRSVGKARDLDVLIQKQLPKCGLAADRLGKIWRKQRRSYQTSIIRVQKKMQKKDCLKTRTRSLISDLRKSNEDVCELGKQRCGDWARTRVPVTCRRYFAAIPAKPDTDSLHRLRILTKRFRYTLDILQSALHNTEISEARAALEQLQKQLGTLQDHVIARKQFQNSLKSLKSIRDQKLVQRLIKKGDRKIAERVDQFRLESDSNACEQLKFCIEAVMSLLKAAEAGFQIQ
jgi:CHAD domain-containing protein